MEEKDQTQETSAIGYGPTLDDAVEAEPKPKSRAKKSSLDEALEIVRAHLESGKKFTNPQIDIAVDVVATMLPEHERQWMKEIARENHYPVWLVLLSQWRRTAEWGQSAALLVDPDWELKIDEVS